MSYLAWRDDDEVLPPLLLLDDQPAACPYLPKRTAKMPLSISLAEITGKQFDLLLHRGYRRSGSFVYATACPRCIACESIRVDVPEFRPNRSQRRAYRRGLGAFSVSLQPPSVTAEKVRLYNLHKRSRGLDYREREIDATGYESFLVDSCVDSFEVELRCGRELAGVGISDRGQLAVSAVYFFFDPNFSSLSPGVFNVLHHIELCKQWNVRWLYLGYFIGDCKHMSYKSAYRPHERLIGGGWKRFE